MKNRDQNKLIKKVNPMEIATQEKNNPKKKKEKPKTNYN